MKWSALDSTRNRQRNGVNESLLSLMFISPNCWIRWHSIILTLSGNFSLNNLSFIDFQEQMRGPSLDKNTYRTTGEVHQNHRSIGRHQHHCLPILLHLLGMGRSPRRRPSPLAGVWALLWGRGPPDQWWARSTTFCTGLSPQRLPGRCLVGYCN